VLALHACGMTMILIGLHRRTAPSRIGLGASGTQETRGEGAGLIGPRRGG
jgi:hypothetical protein